MNTKTILVSALAMAVLIAFNANATPKPYPIPYIAFGGEYNDPALNNLINRVQQRLGAKHRAYKNLTIDIVDYPLPLTLHNDDDQFAISAGLLSLLRSEAELATVISLAYQRGKHLSRRYKLGSVSYSDLSYTAVSATNLNKNQLENINRNFAVQSDRKERQIVTASSVDITETGYPRHSTAHFIKRMLKENALWKTYIAQYDLTAELYNASLKAVQLIPSRGNASNDNFKNSVVRLANLRLAYKAYMASVDAFENDNQTKSLTDIALANRYQHNSARIPYQQATLSGSEQAIERLLSKSIRLNRFNIAANLLKAKRFKNNNKEHDALLLSNKVLTTNYSIQRLEELSAIQQAAEAEKIRLETIKEEQRAAAAAEKSRLEAERLALAQKHERYKRFLTEPNNDVTVSHTLNEYGNLVLKIQNLSEFDLEAYIVNVHIEERNWGIEGTPVAANNSIEFVTTLGPFPVSAIAEFNSKISEPFASFK